MDVGKITQSMFGVPRALIGMLHLGPLPGSPKQRSDGIEVELAEIVARAIEEAVVYRDAGFHGLMIENMHDRPYLKGAVGPEVVAAMAVVGQEVRRAAMLPLGIQVLAGANRDRKLHASLLESLPRAQPILSIELDAPALRALPVWRSPRYAVM